MKNHITISRLRPAGRWSKTFWLAGTLFVSGFTTFAPQAAIASIHRDPDTQAAILSNPSVTKGTIKAASTIIYRVQVPKNQTSQVNLMGDDSTDLDLQIFDSEGNYLCNDNDLQHQNDLFVPKGGVYMVHITNPGKMENKYTLSIR